MKSSRAVILILLFAFALRVYQLDSVRYNFDAGYPHGLGLSILEAVLAGHWGNLPRLSLTSTIGLPNGALASYGWAVVAAFDRSPYFAVFVSAMLNVLVVAQTYAIARRLIHSSLAALVAATLAAGSLWGTWLSRSTAVQGQLEFWATTSAWLLVTALERNRPRRLLAGFAVVAMAIHTYTVALALGAQAFVAALAAGVRNRKLIRAAILGLIVCLLSASLYVLFVTGQSDVLSDILRSGIRNRLATEPGMPETPAGRVDLVGWDHARRMVSGRDFEIFTSQSGSDFIWRKALNDARSTIVDISLVLGMAAVIGLRRFRTVPLLTLLAWFSLPVGLTVGIRLISAGDVAVAPFYLALVSPAGYVLAGLPFALLDSLAPRHPAVRLWSNRLVAALCLATSMVSIAGWQAFATASSAQPLANGIFDVPLRWQTAFGNVWRSQCQEVDNPEIPSYWLVSLLQGSSQLRWAAASWNEFSVAWELPADGGACFTRITPFDVSRAVDSLSEVVPLDLLPVSAPGGSAQTYRSRAISEIEPETESMTTNLGWRLLELKTPAQARPGDTVPIVHIWQIETLPEADYAHWYYAPFVKLIGLDQQTLVDIDRARSVEGYNWRAGDYLISLIQLDIPPAAQPGTYQLQMSLFDPNQKKNAAYFSTEDPATPVVILERALTLTAP
jgi:hypothetical protein